MSTLRVNALQNVAGTGQPAMVGAAKAWVNFGGAGTVAIRSQFNVSSITDNGVGAYTINFTTAFADTNYAPVVGGAAQNNRDPTNSWLVLAGPTHTRNTGNFAFQFKNPQSGTDDPNNVYVAVFSS